MLEDIAISIGIIILIVAFSYVSWKNGYDKGVEDTKKKKSHRIEIKPGTTLEVQRFHERSDKFFLNIKEK